MYAGTALTGFFLSVVCIGHCKSQTVRQIWRSSVLADRTNGRAIGTVLRPSVVCRRRLYGM